MRRTYSFVLPILFILFACQPQSKQTITIIDGDQIHQLVTPERIPASILTQADIHLAANDIVLLNGKPVALDQPIPTAQTYTLQVQRAVALTVNGKIIRATAQPLVRLYRRQARSFMQATKPARRFKLPSQGR